MFFIIINIIIWMILGYFWGSGVVDNEVALILKQWYMEKKFLNYFLSYYNGQFWLWLMDW